MPPGVAAAPTPSVRTSVGSIADRPTARQRSAATAFASPSVTDVNAFSQSSGCWLTLRYQVPQGIRQRSCGGTPLVSLGTPIGEDVRL
jgi:hypothetical protein